MQKDNALRLAFAYAGCFLGAGYVSGQELWQFFGTYGRLGVAGMLLSMVLFFAFGILMLRLIQRTGIDQADALVVRSENRLLRGIYGALQGFFLVGLFVIMAAGGGALAKQVFGLPVWLGSAVFCLLVMLVSLSGTNGMMAVFSAIVPLLVICSVLISLIAVSRYGIDRLVIPPSGEGSSLLGNWVLAAFTYVSYNLFSSIGILAPVGVMIRSRRTVWCGIFISCILLFAIAAGIFLAMHTDLSVTSDALPMLTVAKHVGPVWYYLYALLLFGGMFGTSLSCMVAAQHYGYRRFPQLGMHRRSAALLIGVGVWLGSLFGFGELVGVVYPLCGYCGAFAILGLIHHAASLKTLNKT